MDKQQLEAIRARDARIAGIVGDEYQSQSELDRRALLAAYDALLAAARKVTCQRCLGKGFVLRQPEVEASRLYEFPCPDCADLRKLLEGGR